MSFDLSWNLCTKGFIGTKSREKKFYCTSTEVVVFLKN